MSESFDIIRHVRSLHSTAARAYVRQLNDLDGLTLLRNSSKRGTVREAVEGRISRLRKERNVQVWRPPERDAVIRNTIEEGALYRCPCCGRKLPIGDGLDEIGIRRKRNLSKGRVEYVIRPQSYCHRCQRGYSKEERDS